MNRITLIDRAERHRLEKIVQRSKDKRFSRRANAVLLVHQGLSRQTVVSLFYASLYFATRCSSRYNELGINQFNDAVLGKPLWLPSDTIAKMPHFLIPRSPQDLGYQHSRWSTKLFAKVIGILWQRAAPTLRIRGPYKDEK